MKQELVRVRSTLKQIHQRTTFYLISKIAAHLVQFAFVDMQKLKRIKDLALNQKTKIVFMPMWKSFQDILILHYVNYYADLEIGFTFGNFEDSPKFAFYEKLVKNIGTLLIKRQNSDLCTNYVNASLLQEVMEHNPFTTVFLNDTRPRSGKFNEQVRPDIMIKLLLKCY